MSFVELRAHTAFSFGDGVLTPETLVARAAELGYPALAVTDHADLGGLIRFALAAESAGVKAIAGAELNVDGYPTAFLARDQRGYRNLAALVTRARMGELRSWGAGQRQTGNGLTAGGGGRGKKADGGRPRREPGDGAGKAAGEASPTLEASRARSPSP